MAVIVSPIAMPWVVAADLETDRVIATAVTANAAPILSGDSRLLNFTNHPGIRIVAQPMHSG
jgi:hypothetical protein